MISSLNIQKWGSFLDQKVNLENESSVIHIIGMNDVGKTALLSAMQSHNKGLNVNEKYKWNNELPNIETELKICIEQYNEDKDLVELFESLKFELYEGSIILKSHDTFRVSTEVFKSTPKIKEWTNNLISKINSNLPEENLIKDLEEIEEQKLNTLLYNIKNGKIQIDEVKKITDYVEALIKFKNFIYEYCKYSTTFLAADTNDEFSFIKSKYYLREKRDPVANKLIPSDEVEIKKFLSAFFTENEVSKFFKIIESDNKLEQKEAALSYYEEKISEKMNEFFEDNFKSQSKDLRFNIRTDAQNQTISIFVTDYVDRSLISEYKLQLWNRSDGFNWFLKLYMVLKSIKSFSTIIIDEPEKFLHASAQKELVKLFEKEIKEKKIQVIYATHSVFMLTKTTYPSLKIVTKEEGGSVIYNNINAFINKNSEKWSDIVSPVCSSLGINIQELDKLWTYDKKYLIVEGEADINAIELSYYISNKEHDFKIVFLGGKDSIQLLKTLELINAKHRSLILLDKVLDMEKYKGWNTITIDKLMSDSNITEPEDMLEDKTKMKYKISKNNHKMGWKNLYDAVISKKYELSEEEKKKLVLFQGKLDI